MKEQFKKRVYNLISSLTIVCLITSFVFGFPFNVEFKFNSNNGVKKIVSIIEQVQADNASTTVTVKNGPPYFTVDAAEVVVSASTSPVNIGNSISFTATANDYESNGYYLLICDNSASAATTTGGVPSCVNSSGVIDNSLRLCAANATSSVTNPSSCTYSSVTDNGTEVQDWEAYICDDHDNEPVCSETPNTGSGDSGSPMYLNHYPKLELAYTSNDDNDPGALFEITASTTDTDVMGGADVIFIDVCSSDSWASSTGCTARTYCSASSTATTSAQTISCSFTASSTLPDTDYTYYVFAIDSHDFISGDNSVNNTYTVNNVSPEISGVILNGGLDIALDIKGNSTTINTYSTSIADNNGCTDLSNNGYATSTIYLSSVGSSCNADDNDCYQLASTTCSFSECSGDDDATAKYSCTTTMEFFVIPTDSGDYIGDSWFSKITVTDEEFATSSTSSVGNQEVLANSALDISESEIAYGVVKSTFDTGADNATTTVVNYGNTPIDSDVSGEHMTSGESPDVIDIENQEYSLTSFTYGNGATTTPSSTPATVDTVIPRPTNLDDVSDEIYWGIGIPVGIHSGDYSGVNYFEVAVDGSGNWN